MCKYGAAARMAWNRRHHQALSLRSTARARSVLPCLHQSHASAARLNLVSALTPAPLPFLVHASCALPRTRTTRCSLHQGGVPAFRSPQVVIGIPMLLHIMLRPHVVIPSKHTCALCHLQASALISARMSALLQVTVETPCMRRVHALTTSTLWLCLEATSLSSLRSGYSRYIQSHIYCRLIMSPAGSRAICIWTCG